MDTAAAGGAGLPPERSGAVTRPSKALKLLVLDDEAAVRDRVAAALSEVPGVEVIAEDASVDDPYGRVMQIQPDVLIVDVRMPHGQAIELIRRIKAGGSRPLVIALSSVPSLQYRTVCHGAGAAYFFDKARELDRLVEAVASLRAEIG